MINLHDDDEPTVDDNMSRQPFLSFIISNAQRDRVKSVLQEYNFKVNHVFKAETITIKNI